jgi:SAM-dependent methyltransferase
MWEQGYEKSAHLYDLFDTKDNIPFFLDYGLAAGEILDIGAGTGRIAIPLAEEGVRIFCVEPSPAMRAVFEEKLSSRNDLKQKITLFEGEAKNFDLGRTFQAAYLSGTFDHFVNHEDRMGSLLNIRKHLCTGGMLIFDVFIGLMQDMPLSPAGEVVRGNRVYQRSFASKVLPENRLEVELVYEILENETVINRIEERSLAGMVDRRKIHELLKRTGFEVEAEFGNYQRDPFQEQDGILIMQAVRKD